MTLQGRRFIYSKIKGGIQMRRINTKCFAGYLILWIFLLMMTMQTFAAKNPYSGGTTNCGYVAWDCAKKHTGVELPVFIGAAKKWYSQAKQMGLSTGTEPREKSIVVLDSPAMGHVAYVETYDAVSGQIFIHEAAIFDETRQVKYHECWMNAVGYRFGSKDAGDGSRVIGYIYLQEEKDSLPKVSVKKLSAAKKSFTVKWKKAKEEIAGYQIQYALDKKMSAQSKKISVSGWNKTSRKIKGLKAKTKYFVRIRTYVKRDGKKVYSGWSKVKNVTTK